MDRLTEERVHKNFNYKIFILQNLQNIYDYEILKRALKISIENIKTRENAVTTVRKILNNYEAKEKIIIMDTYKIIREMGRYIVGLKVED